MFIDRRAPVMPTFDDWCDDQGGRAENSFEVRNPDGTRTLLFGNGASATTVRPGFYLQSQPGSGKALMVDNSGVCWLTTESPGEPDSLQELQGARKNTETILGHARRQFDSLQQRLLTHGSSGPDDEQQLERLKDRADHWFAHLQSLDEQIAAHPQTARLKQQAQENAAWRASIEAQGQAQRYAAEQRLRSIQYQR